MRTTSAITVLALAAFLLGFTSGCETYNNQLWTPDGLNYTMQRDRATGQMSDYFGLTWNLKPEKK